MKDIEYLKGYEAKDAILDSYVSGVKKVEEVIESASSVDELQEGLNSLIKPEGQWINLEGMHISESSNSLKGHFYMASTQGFIQFESEPYSYIIKEEFFDISYGNWYKHHAFGESIQYYGSLSLHLAKGLGKVLESLVEKRKNLADTLTQAKLETIQQFSLDNEVSFKELKLLKDRVSFIEAYLQSSLDTERNKLDNLYKQATKAIEVPKEFNRCITFDKPCILFTDLELK